MNHPNRNGKYELVFVGAASVTLYKLPRYRRMHKTVEAATATAKKVHEAMREKDMPTSCHPAIVYGPGCGEDGTVVSVG